MNKPLKWQKMLLCILIPLAVGALAGRLSREGMSLYQTMAKPLLSPPGWVFPVMWSLLYVLMGAASCLVYCSEAILSGRCCFFALDCCGCPSFGCCF